MLYSILLSANLLPVLTQPEVLLHSLKIVHLQTFFSHKIASAFCPAFYSVSLFDQLLYVIVIGT